MQRVDPRKIEAMIAESAEAPEPAAAPPAPPAPRTATRRCGPTAGRADQLRGVAKVDLRVARVVAAEDVPGAKKLLKLTLSLGGAERRNVFAGIKTVYQPERLVGRLVICAANLAPRKMKFGTSDGMIVAAGGGENEIFLLAPDSGAKPGQRVH